LETSNCEGGLKEVPRKSGIQFMERINWILKSKRGIDIVLHEKK